MLLKSGAFLARELVVHLGSKPAFDFVVNGVVRHFRHSREASAGRRRLRRVSMARPRSEGAVIRKTSALDSA